MKALAAQQILEEIEQRNSSNSDQANRDIDESMAKIDENHHHNLNDRSLTSQISSSLIHDTAKALSQSLATVNTGSATHKPCNCRKSKCLKLYCECFANNRYCGAACSCTCCHNQPRFDKIRINAKQHILMRNPQAFRQSKIVNQSS